MCVTHRLPGTYQWSKRNSTFCFLFNKYLTREHPHFCKCQVLWGNWWAWWSLGLLLSTPVAHFLSMWQHSPCSWMGALTDSPQWVASWNGMCHTWDKHLRTSEKETFWSSLSWRHGRGRHPPGPWVAGMNEHTFLPMHSTAEAVISYRDLGGLCYPRAPRPFGLIQYHDGVTDRGTKVEFPVICRRSRLGKIPQACRWNDRLDVCFPDLGLALKRKACPWLLIWHSAQRQTRGPLWESWSQKEGTDEKCHVDQRKSFLFFEGGKRNQNENIFPPVNYLIFNCVTILCWCLLHSTMNQP